ncbi:prefoldin subunit alpha [Candidatus Woesearchaeota archaeon]|nr:prefoldin subunit alpha [Candidatus Woesearchaeota archaeon]
MNLNEETQKKYLELQLLDQQIKQLQQQLMTVNQQIVELRRVDDDLSEFEKVKENSNMFFALGPGIFAEGSISSKDLLLNVGSNVLVKKPVIDTKKLINVQVAELEGLMVRLQEDMGAIGLRGNELQEELTELNTKKDK